MISGIVLLLANYIMLPQRMHNGLHYLGLMTYSYYLIHGLPGYFLEPFIDGFWPSPTFPFG